MKTILASAALVALALPAHAAINVTDPSFTYLQSFDSLTSTSWSNDSTLTGWSLFTAGGAGITGLQVNNGSSNTGSFYSFGSTGSSERALGGVASGGAYFGSPATGSTAGYVVASFTNTSDAAFDSFTLSFDGEQWRDGGATTPNAQTMVLEYGFGSSYSTASWVAPGGGFNFTSPVFVITSTNPGAAGAVNGNATGLVTGLGGTVSTTWASGDTLWVRWTERNDAGNDHGLAIDNFSLSVTAAVPEPGTTAMLLAGLACLGFIARRRRG